MVVGNWVAGRDGTGMDVGKGVGIGMAGGNRDGVGLKVPFGGP